MRWLKVRSRAKRIRQITEQRLREKFAIELEPDEIDLCVQFEMARRTVKAEDIKLVRETKRLGGDMHAERMKECLDNTRLQRILNGYLGL